MLGKRDPEDKEESVKQFSPSFFVRLLSIGRSFWEVKATSKAIEETFFPFCCTSLPLINFPNHCAITQKETLLQPTQMKDLKRTSFLPSFCNTSVSNWKWSWVTITFLTIVYVCDFLLAVCFQGWFDLAFGNLRGVLRNQILLNCYVHAKEGRLGIASYSSIIAFGR